MNRELISFFLRDLGWLLRRLRNGRRKRRGHKRHVLEILHVDAQGRYRSRFNWRQHDGLRFEGNVCSWLKQSAKVSGDKSGREGKNASI